MYKQGEKIPANISEEDLNSLQKALREQELYLQAYQKDNERLTAELKGAQVTSLVCFCVCVHVCAYQERQEKKGSRLSLRALRFTSLVCFVCVCMYVLIRKDKKRKAHG